MTADDERRIDDQVQEEVLAQWEADHQEAGELGDLLVLLLAFTVSVALIAAVVVAAVVTDDDRFWGLLLLILSGIAVGSSYILRKPTGRAS